MSSSEITTTSSNDNYTSYKCITREDVLSLFGEMRHTTEEESKLYNQMLENIPHINFDINIFYLK